MLTGDKQYYTLLAEIFAVWSVTVIIGITLT